jgi:hypothetical protein
VVSAGRQRAALREGPRAGVSSSMSTVWRGSGTPTRRDAVAAADGVRQPGFAGLTVWLHARCPHRKEIQSAYRTAAGPARVLPSPPVAAGTQGGAIDWWLRFLLVPAPSLQLPVVGLQLRRDLPCWKAAVGLLAGLGVITRDDERAVGQLPDWTLSISRTQRHS